MKVYIASPYSNGDKIRNIVNAINAAEALSLKGHTPFVPHLSHYWDVLNPHPYELWIKYTMKWLKVCDAVLRLPGDSPGADKEVQWAIDNELPVYHSIKEIPNVI